MTGPSSLSGTLKDLRQQAGLSQTAAAAAAGLSQASVARFETGMQVPTDKQIRDLCRAYGVSPAVQRRLLRAVVDVRVQTTAARIALNRGVAWKIQAKIGRIEKASLLICGFEALLVPGLFQTEDYMRAVFATGGLHPADLERSVTARLLRQQQIRRGQRVRYVVPEGALWFQLGGAGVMAAQLDRLAEIAAAGAAAPLAAGVIPWTVPAPVPAMHGFHLYDAREVTVGTLTGTSFITGARDVAEYVKLWQALDSAAVYGEEAAAVFARGAARYRQG